MAWLTEHVYALAFVAAVVDATALPFPGRLLLVVTGAIAAQGEANVVLVIGLAAAGALIGDHLWYAIGRFTGRGPLRLVCRLAGTARRQCEQRSTDYYRRYGAAAIVLGRFVAGVRIATTPLAARGTIPYPRYLAWEGVGALLWAGAYVLLGYVVGAPAVRAVHHSGWLMAGALALGVVSLAAPMVYRWRKRTRLARSGARA